MRNSLFHTQFDIPNSHYLPIFIFKKLMEQQTLIPYQDFYPNPKKKNIHIWKLLWNFITILKIGAKEFHTIDEKYKVPLILIVVVSHNLNKVTLNNI